LIQGVRVETTPTEGKVAKEGGRREGNKVLAAVVLHYVAGDPRCVKPESDLCIIIHPLPRTALYTAHSLSLVTAEGIIMKVIT
jgi:hypothetical protein